APGRARDATETFGCAASPPLFRLSYLRVASAVAGALFGDDGLAVLQAHAARQRRRRPAELGDALGAHGEVADRAQPGEALGAPVGQRQEGALDGDGEGVEPGDAGALAAGGRRSHRRGRRRGSARPDGSTLRRALLKIALLGLGARARQRPAEERDEEAGPD